MSSSRSTPAYINTKKEELKDGDLNKKKLPTEMRRKSTRTKRRREDNIPSLNGKNKKSSKTEKKINSAKKIKTLEMNLIESRNKVKLIHVIPSEEIKFTIPSSDKTELYTASFQIGNGDENPEIQFRCDCGDKYGIFNRNNCKHIGRIVSFVVEEYIKVGLENKPNTTNVGQISNQLSKISID